MGPFAIPLASTRRLLAIATVLFAIEAIAAVPPGYRYIGSRTVSAGRVVLWYWNPDVVEWAGSPTSFAARLYARAVDISEERPYVAIVRCNDRTYRPASETGPFLPIDDGEPIAAVWRAGCANGVVVSAPERRARLEGNVPGSTGSAMMARGPDVPGPGTAARSAPGTDATSPAVAATQPFAAATPSPAAAKTTPATAAASPPAAPAASPATAASAAAASTPASTDPRRVDACVRFSDARSSPAGDATITNVCTHPVEVTLCYKGGGGGPHDCGSPVRGRLSDSLGPGITHVLPEYRRGRHRGIAWVACRGTPGTVFPRLEDPGRSACL